jgi:hypothetical protein
MMTDAGGREGARLGLLTQGAAIVPETPFDALYGCFDAKAFPSSGAGVLSAALVVSS